MKFMLDLKNFQKPSKNDIIVHDGNDWVIISKDLFLAEKEKEIRELSEKLIQTNNLLAEEVKKLKYQVNVLAKAIGGKQE